MAAVYRRERENPSFSSTLLDAIYRSVDEESAAVFRESTGKKQSKFVTSGGVGDDRQDLAGLRRACLIEKWMMKKKVEERVVVGRRSAADVRDLNSSSSSSDSSSGGGFSSSEAESLFGGRIRPKPIRTGADQHYGENHKPYDSKPNPKHEGKFVKTKLRALKIYGDLKKVKQPISPGGRLSAFLNSIFTAGNAKKTKIAAAAAAYGGGNGYNGAPMSQLDRKSKSANASTCSSASSFSRSCLSKTPSSGGKLGNGLKRSVRFFPVSVIVDEDSQPCGQKSLYGEDSDFNPTIDELKMHLNPKNRHVEEAARNLLKNYQQKVEREFNDEDDDTESYSSSDLFELDNLSAIGMERYREELPVYETTHLDTNQAIAKGFLV